MILTMRFPLHPNLEPDLIVVSKQRSQSMGMTYDQWKKQVEYLLILTYHLAIDDLPDAPLARWYSEHVSPKTAMKKLIAHARTF